MIQTHYVPLSPPYRIIYTGGVLGIQIGTLIVVSTDDNSMLFQTKTHPVVSYVNKELCKEKDLYISDVMIGGMNSEAEVWYNVEQKDVATLCLVGQKFSWDDFLEILTPLISDCHDEKSATLNLRKARNFRSDFYLLGGHLAPPPGYESLTNYFGETSACEFQILIEQMPNEDEGDTSAKRVFCTEIGCDVPFMAKTDDPEEAYAILQKQLYFYKQTFRMIMAGKPLRFYFEPGGCCEDEADPEVVKLVERLNGIA